MKRVLPLLVLLLALPTAAHAAEEGGVGHLVWEYVNLVGILVVLVYFGRKPLRGFFAERHDRIRENLVASEKLLTEARDRLEQWTARMERLDDEVAHIRDVSRRSAELDREQIIAQAHAAAERIRASAHAAVDRELRHAQEELRAEAAALAVEVAGRVLREQVGEADRGRLVDEFIERIDQERAH